MNPSNTWKGKLEAASFLPCKNPYRQCVYLLELVIYKDILIAHLSGGTYLLTHFLGNFREKTKKVPTRTVSRKLPEISRKFPKKLTALLPLTHFY
jgi:hypothetical protein